MKKLSVAVVSLLIGCTNPTSAPIVHDNSVDDVPAASGYPDRDYSIDGPGFHCNPSLYEMTYNGHVYLVSVPAACDPNPYIYKGDPGPDMGDLADLDISVQNEIIHVTCITHNINQ